jgi:hypothetical protein
MQGSRHGLLRYFRVNKDDKTEANMHKQAMMFGYNG